VASELLKHVALPPGSMRVERPPSGVRGLLGRPLGTRFAHVVDRHAFWTANKSPRAVLAFVLAHAPSGARMVTSGSGEQYGRAYYWWEEINVPGQTSAVQPQRLTVAIVRMGSRSFALRVDARVAWHLARPANSLVPSTAAWLKVTVVEPGFRGLPGETSRPRRTRSLTTTDAHTVQTVARAVNELPVAEPAGPVPSCPATSVNAMGSPKLILTFRKNPLGSDLAHVTAAGSSVCSRVGEATATITTPEQRGLLLTDHLTSISELEGTSLADHIEAALDHRLQLPRG
jgi:hypothetical protein